jgi:SOS-response transcriptional repressor LexA
MIDAGLEPGVLVIIRPKVTPNEKDICAVWIEGFGNTLKCIAYEGDQIILYPANKRYKPRSYAADSARVQGVLIASLAVKYHHHR